MNNTENDKDFLWLEEVESPKALAWAEEQNQDAFARLKSDPRFDPLRESILSVMNAEDKMQLGSQTDEGFVYNFEQNAEHKRGIWRRCRLADYMAGSKTGNFNWDVLLDIDQLNREEDASWVAKGFSRSPNNKRVLVSLSRGGGDATVVREFCLESRAFVEGGFFLPEAKSDVCWEDDDTLLVATNRGEDSLTESGYPRSVVRLKRGQKLEDAEVVFTTSRDHVLVAPGRWKLPEGDVCTITCVETFFTESIYLSNGNGDFEKVNVPDTVELEEIRHGQLLFSLRKEWQVNGETYPQGSLVLYTPDNGDTELLWRPSETTVFDGVARVKGGFLLTLMEDVTDKALLLRCENGKWQEETLPLPEKGILGVHNTSAKREDFMYTFSNCVTPSTLCWYNFSTGASEQLQQTPPRFDATGMTVTRKFATSADGTKVPYFVMHKEGLPLDGTNPTWLYGYGGFENSMQPGYSALFGKHWVAEGGVFVIANIRGGGEYGPAWHQAALKHNRQRCYDDFIAVAEDLIGEGVTSPRRLGIEGGSNGGLLVGATMTQRPDLFNAVVCAVPLLDMLRYHELPAGASWIGEYGDPRIPEDRAVIETYSPFQNLSPDADYPEAFIWTSTRDDRVHPGHARKMVAKMKAMGHPVLYFENTEGGHGAGADNEQSAVTNALEIVYMMQKLMD